MISPEYGSTASLEARPMSIDLGRDIGRVELIGFNATKAQEVAAGMLANLYPAPIEESALEALINAHEMSGRDEVPQAA